MKNLYCSACNKLFKNVKSFENHENSKKHKENVAKMTLDDDIGISDVDDEENEDVEQTPATQEEPREPVKINGLTEDEKEPLGNSTSDIEDNDIRETLSDDSGKVKVREYLNNFSLALNLYTNPIFVFLFAASSQMFKKEKKQKEVFQSYARKRGQ